MSGRGRAGRRQRSHDDHDEGHENAERWLLSYADMITLLMALFIVLFAISQVDQKKLMQLSAGLDQYFGEPAVVTSSTGILEGSPQWAPNGRGASPNPTTSPEPIVPPRPSVAPTPAAVSKPSPQVAAREAQRESLTALRNRIAAALAAKGLAGAVEFQIRDHGLVVNVVTDRVLFDLGEASLRPEGRRVLDAIAPVIVRLPNSLTVEGHTDNVPISGRFPSNWELSTERATTVLRYLLTRGVAASRVSAAGYADQRPLSTNQNPVGRARNRRVAIVVLATPDAISLASARTSSTATSTGD
jgi:chemotaxis protein MotB